MRMATWAVREMENHIMPMLRKCTNFSALKKIHARIVVLSLAQSCFLSTRVISVCIAIGRIDHATLVFNHVEEKNSFLYNAMIRAHTQNNQFSAVIYLYREMLGSSRKVPIVSDRFTYPFVIRACAGLLILDLGKQVHARIFKSGLDWNVIIQNSLIEMYTKCARLSDAQYLFDEMEERDAVSWNLLISANARLEQIMKARILFDSMPKRSIVSWTAMISGYTSSGFHNDAVKLFYEMQLQGVEPDDISIVSVLPACAQLGALELGKWIHAYCGKHGLLKKTFVCNALMEMYAKSGSIDEAQQIFENIHERDVISWSTMITGLATHGKAHEAIQFFANMEKDKRVRPNCITFLGVLSACSHACLLDEGLQYFTLMKAYGIDPEIEHYGCMVDLLGRSGCIDQAVELIDNMPIHPDVRIWGSLLNACKSYGNIEVAIKATKQLLELEPEDTGIYVMLSNIYAAAQMWDGVAKMRKLVRNRNMKKTPGCSLIEVDNMVQEFAAGDETNPQFSKISEILDLLASELGKPGAQRTFGNDEQLTFWDLHHELNSDIYVM